MNANTMLQEVYDHEATEFGGDPVASIIPSSNESDYRTTSENRRSYAFSVRLWVKRGDPRSDAKVDQIMRELCDSVLDDFDRYYTFGTGSPGATLVQPTGYTIIRLHALPSTWGYVEREALYRIADVTVRVEVDVDVTQIS